MSRIGIFTSALPRWRYNVSPVGQGHTTNKSFDERQFGFLGRSGNSGGIGQIDGRLGTGWDSNGTVFNYTNVCFYSRFRVVRAPTSSGDLYSVHTRTAAAIEFHIQLNSSRQLLLYNDAGTANLMATSSAVTLGAWNEMYGRLQVSTTTPNLGKCQLLLNGVTVFDNLSGGSIPGVGLGLNAAAANPIYIFFPNMCLDSNIGAEIDFDQLICDDTDAITSPSYFTYIPITGQGASNAWSTSGGADLTKDKSFRMFEMAGMNDSGISFPEMVASTANLDQSYTTRTLAACGLNSGSGIKTAIITHDIFNATNVRHFYTLNGGAQVVESAPVGSPGFMTYSLHVASGWGLTDAIEIGVKSVAVATQRCGYLGLWIEHTVDITHPDVDTSVVIQRMNYTGNGAGANSPQIITLPFTPTFLLIQPRTGTGFSYWWTSKGGYIQNLTGAMRRSSYVLEDGLRLCSGPELNVNGTVYDVTCVKDEEGRIFGPGSFFQQTQTVPFDTDNLQVNTPHANPEAVWSISYLNGFVGSVFMMGPNQTANNSLPFTAGALTANIFDVLNSTGFVMHKGRYTNASGMQYPFISFRPDGFVTQRIFDIVTWVGDGTSDRTIPVPNMSTLTPVNVIVFPHNNSARYLRNNQQAGASNFAGGALSATVLHTFAAGSFKVSSTLNTNLINYTAFVFAEGTDSGIISNQYSGIYFIDPAARHDTLWDRSGDDPVTVDLKIPDPLGRTAFFGDS